MQRIDLRNTPLGLFAFIWAAVTAGPAFADQSVESYLDLNLEDLLSTEITSVSRKRQPLSEAAAAVFVITQNDIRRAGVTSIPEALRMAPGIQVAKLDTNKWAISSRGFNAQFANKLLVLIDGRSVYTPAFSGVYWEIQDTLLEDIDRIEVIRGPGATVWGANAVNGVINIITKHAAETRDGLLVAGAGNEEKGFVSLRHGIELGKNTYGRAYFKYNSRDSSYSPLLDGDAGDDWQAQRAGFRLDGALGKADNWTLQGDIYDTDEDQIVKGLFRDPADPANNPPYRDLSVPARIDTSGWNLLGRWEHLHSATSGATLQVYYDHNERSEAILGQTHDTLDFDFQHQASPWSGHDIVWGLGYRYIATDFDNTFSMSIAPEQQSQNLYSAFVQDEIELMPNKLRLTLGSKLEYNDFTGFETQPSARLLWHVRKGHTLWGAISRAVRTPSQVEDGSRIITTIVPIAPPLIITVNGNKEQKAEKLTATELGYRLQPMENLSMDLALFYNKYDDIGTFEQTAPTTIIFDNKRDVSSYGAELSVDWLVREWWRLQANYSYLHISENVDDDSTDDIAKNIEGSAPSHQLSTRSAMDLSDSWSLDLWVYYVDDLKSTAFANQSAISDYTSVNARLAWRPSKKLEFSLNGHNLLDNRHAEFIGEEFILPTEVERSVHGQVHWEF